MNRASILGVLIVLAGPTFAGSWLVGCASAKMTNPVVVTPISYNSTDPKASPSAASKKAGEVCDHVWQSGSPHMYLDEGYSPPVTALCTPVVCIKCGLLRHECQTGKRRR